MPGLFKRSYRTGLDSFFPAERFRMILPATEANIYNKTNITLGSGQYKNMK